MYQISTASALGTSDSWTELTTGMFCLIFKLNFLLGIITPWFLHCATLKCPKQFLPFSSFPMKTSSQRIRIVHIWANFSFWGVVSLFVCWLIFFVMQLYSHFSSVFIPNPLICTNALVTRRCPQQKALFQMESCWSHAERDYNLPV